MSHPDTPFIIVNGAAQRALITASAAAADRLKMPAAVVGGFPRDCLLGRTAADLDIAAEGDAKALAEAIAAESGGSVFTLDQAAGMYRVTLPVGSAFGQIDVGAAHGSLEADLRRRDFTADALAAPLAGFDPASGRMDIIDLTGGLADIRNRVLRAVAPDIFRQDPARLLRGARLAAELDFSIEANTEALITAEASLAAGTAGERTREELLRLFSLPRSGQITEYLDRLGLIKAIFPELEASRGLVQPREHAWDVLNHQLKTISALNWIFRQGNWPHAAETVRDMIPLPDRAWEYFSTKVNGFSRLALSRLAALLHDVAKPETRVLTDTGRIRFFGHAQKGAITAATILERLRFSKRETEFVCAMVRAHLRPVQMGPEAILPTPRAVYRYRRDTGEAAVANLYLSLADHLAARGPELELDNFNKHVTIVDYILGELERQSAGAEKQHKLISGHDLQRWLRMKPGPRMGAVLEAVREAQAAGEITSRRQALELARQIIKTEQAQ